jgi:predicted nucleic acid-binding Zn ribbon protein
VPTLAPRLARLASLALAAAALAGCGGGAKTVENPITPPATPAAYSGPAPATADVQAFRINVWDNLKAANRCGQCHTQGGQAPPFVRTVMVLLPWLR